MSGGAKSLGRARQPAYHRRPMPALARTVRIVRRYAQPRAQVWRALTDAEQLGRWFMPNDFQPELERDFTFRMKPQRGWDGVTWCRVLELEPERRLAYSYRGQATGEKTLACAGVRSETAKQAARGIFTELDTVLRFTLDDEPGGGTRLTLEHAGFAGLKLVLVSLVMGMGYRRSVLPRLARLLADG
jgi:uncharacterized protein YndB with AHSA1/START domain